MSLNSPVPTYIVGQKKSNLLLRKKKEQLDYVIFHLAKLAMPNNFLLEGR
jgi:hypothetical protein